MDLSAARSRLAQEADRRAAAQAAIEREPASPRTPAGGWLGPFPTPDPVGGRGALNPASVRRDHAATPRAKPPPGVTYRPTPTPQENARKAANPSDIVSPKMWDTSPLQQSFDMTVPPDPRVDPPVPDPLIFETVLAGLQLPDILGNCTAMPAPTAGSWRLIDSGGIDDVRVSGTGQMILVNADSVVAQDYFVRVECSNAGGPGRGIITVRFFATAARARARRNGRR